MAIVNTIKLYSEIRTLANHTVQSMLNKQGEIPGDTVVTVPDGQQETRAEAITEIDLANASQRWVESQCQYARYPGHYGTLEVEMSPPSIKAKAGQPFSFSEDLQGIGSQIRNIVNVGEVERERPELYAGWNV
ncbi:hypothetical protein BDM02DRAFT_3121270 [Thelephora ganbajun]|uniref:Uncharacterized protein n=1 Tax=Thelephora ganbajun TaxID=370292 RepID=A0ACB6Z565_THEGA|nr:hypothetical protein BDM02DRAFT_3121270 [Thelephora ganbajun]